jgi:hypothetical protein
MGNSGWERNTYYTADVGSRKPFKVVEEDRNTFSVWRPEQLDFDEYDDGNYTILMKRYDDIINVWEGKNLHGFIKAILLQRADMTFVLISYRLVEFSLDPFLAQTDVTNFRFTCNSHPPKTDRPLMWSDLPRPVLETDNAVYFLGHDQMVDIRTYKVTKRLLGCTGDDTDFDPYRVFYHIIEMGAEFSNQHAVMTHHIRGFRMLNARLW